MKSCAFAAEDAICLVAIFAEFVLAYRLAYDFGILIQLNRNVKRGAASIESFCGRSFDLEMHESLSPPLTAGVSGQPHFK
jgi:hypothetical protein